MELDIVLALLKNTNGEILLLKRKSTVHNPNVWELPGGKVDLNENKIDGLRRQVRTELNTEIKNIELVHVLTTIHELGKLVFYIYSVEACGEFTLSKHSEAKYLSIKESFDLHLAKAAQKVMEIEDN